jgi:hypothetical protein
MNSKTVSMSSAPTAWASFLIIVKARAPLTKVRPCVMVVSERIDKYV